MKKDKQEKIRDKKLWSFSTTLRHPDRVVDFLTALETFDGKDWNNETQKNVGEKMPRKTINQVGINIKIIQNKYF